MKKHLLALLAITSLLIMSCSKDGEIGPKGDKGEIGQQGTKGDTGDKGDKGDPGNDGVDGTANAFSYLYTDQQLGDLQAIGPDVNGNYIFSATKSFTPDKLGTLANTGLVLVYLKDKIATNSNWSLASMTGIGYVFDGDGTGDPLRSATPIQFTSSYNDTSVQIKGTSTANFLDGNYIKNYRFDVKIILVEASSIPTVQSARIDLKNIASVENYFRLKK